MGRFKSTIFLLIILISLKIMVGSSYSLDVVSAPDGDRLARVEALLETVVNKNQELEKRIEHLETELQVQTKVNDELLDRISELETIKRVNTQSDAQEISENSGHRDENKAVNERSNQTYLWEERQDSPKLRRNHNNNIKRLLLPLQTTTSIPLNHKTVAFTAYLSADISGLGPGQGIIFDKVITNVGGGYHKTHGYFIAPIDGVYAFTVMATAYSGHYEHIEFVKDGVGVVFVFVGAPSGYYISSSGIITLSLSKGNEVWIRTIKSSGHGSGRLHGRSLHTSFSGWLLA